ncbi:ferredoxin [Paraclostridium dentum]|uniref:ferredoxin n=1 Tax=Paraclostridium dentum TaxID=2662455 RepID=UPI003B00A6C6
MKAFVDRDGCIGCQACAGTCPDVFSMDDDNISVPIKEDIPEEVLDSAKDARDGCPVSVISIK